VKVRFPLSVKILLWFFLNLVLLGAVLYGFFRIQFRLGLDSLTGTRPGPPAPRRRATAAGAPPAPEVHGAHRQPGRSPVH